MGITYAMIVFNGKAQTIPLLKSYVDKTFGKKIMVALWR